MGNVSLTTVNVTYLFGGFFFSLGGYTSVLMPSNDTVGAPMHWWSHQPGRREWLSAVVLFVGTLFFLEPLGPFGEPRPAPAPRHLAP